MTVWNSSYSGLDWLCRIPRSRLRQLRRCVYLKLCHKRDVCHFMAQVSQPSDNSNDFSTVYRCVFTIFWFALLILHAKNEFCKGTFGFKRFQLLFLKKHIFANIVARSDKCNDRKIISHYYRIMIKHYTKCLQNY